MKKYFKSKLPFFLLLFSSFFFLSGTYYFENDPSPYEIVKGMFVKTNAITSMNYTMKKQERFHGKLHMQQTAVKLNRNPLKVYLRQELPKEGLEVLFVQGANNNNALVNTNGFPWVNLSLDPMGSTMRENQHHTLYDSGYSHLVSILEHLCNKYNKDIQTMITSNGTVNWSGHTCWSITFSDPDFKYYPYTVKAGETVLTIAAKSKLSEYMILELNKNISNYTDISPGQVINVPNDYSPKLEIYIDKQQMIPFLIKVYDEKGLYEQYEYYKVVINPVFKSNEFDKSFPEYKF